MAVAKSERIWKRAKYVERISSCARKELARLRLEIWKLKKHSQVEYALCVGSLKIAKLLWNNEAKLRIGNKSEMLGWINFQEERIYKDISTRKNLLIALRILREEFWHKETSFVFNPLKNKWKSRWQQSTVPRLIRLKSVFRILLFESAGVPWDKIADLSEFKPDFCFDDSASYPAVNTSFNPIRLMVAVLRTIWNTQIHTVCWNIEFRVIKPGCTQSGH